MTSHVRRIFLLSTGWISFVIGVIGIFLPLLPTTPFMLVTVYCFAKSSPRLHAMIINHPRFGPPLRDWQESRVIRPRAKVSALLVLAATLAFSWWKIPLSKWPIHLFPTIACMGAATFILMQRSKPKD